MASPSIVVFGDYLRHKPSLGDRVGEDVRTEHCGIAEREYFGIGDNSRELPIESGDEYTADGRLHEKADQRERHLELRHIPYSGIFGTESVQCDAESERIKCGGTNCRQRLHTRHTFNRPFYGGNVYGKRPVFSTGGYEHLRTLA